MKAVFSKEFRSVVKSYFGMSHIFLALVMSGIFMTYWNLNGRSGAFEVVFGYMPLVMIALIPLLTVGAFSGERTKGTDRFLALLPIYTRDIVLGKYFARLSVAMIPNVIMLLYPVILDFYGGVNYITAYIALLAYCLFEAMLIAICLFIDAHFNGKIVRFAVPYTFLVVWFALGIASAFMPSSAIFSLIAFIAVALVVSALVYIWQRRLALTLAIAAMTVGAPVLAFVFSRPSMNGAFGRVLDIISPFTRLEYFIYGIVDFRTVFIYVSLTVVFVMLTAVYFGKRTGTYRFDSKKPAVLRAASAGLSLLLIFAAVFANLGVIITPDRFAMIDVTKTRSYTLTSQNKEFLSKLDSDVTVYAVNYDSEEYRIQLFLERLASYSDHLTVKSVNTEKDTEFCEKYGFTGIAQDDLNNFLFITGEKRNNYVEYSSLFSYSNATIGFSNISITEFLQYYQTFASNSAYSQYLQYLESDTDMYFEGQSVIMQVIEYVCADMIPTYYTLGGHGDISGSLLDYATGYKLIDITDGSAVPEDAASVLIAKPSTDLSDGELLSLKSYLASGGQVTVLTGEENLDMPNLMSLLADYGMSAEKGGLRELVAKQTEESTDNGDAFEETAENSEQENTDAVEEESATLTVTPNEQHDLTAMLIESAASSSTELKLSVTNANSIKLDSSFDVKPLLTTSENAYQDGAPENKGVHTVAAAAELPRGDRVVWFTGADSFIGFDSVSDADEIQVNNTTCVLASTYWTTKTYASVLVNAPATLYTNESLVISDTAVTVMGTVIIAIIPAVFAAVVLAVRYKRKKA